MSDRGLPRGFDGAAGDPLASELAGHALERAAATGDSAADRWAASRGGEPAGSSGCGKGGPRPDLGQSSSPHSASCPARPAPNGPVPSVPVVARMYWNPCRGQRAWRGRRKSSRTLFPGFPAPKLSARLRPYPCRRIRSARHRLECARPASPRSASAAYRDPPRRTCRAAWAPTCASGWPGYRRRPRSSHRDWASRARVQRGLLRTRSSPSKRCTSCRHHSPACAVFSRNRSARNSCGCQAALTS